MLNKLPKTFKSVQASTTVKTLPMHQRALPSNGTKCQMQVGIAYTAAKMLESTYVVKSKKKYKTGYVTVGGRRYRVVKGEVK